MEISRVGEFGLIRRIERLLRTERKPVLGIGDDAAAFRTVDEDLTLLTTDAMVEGIHFDLRYTPCKELGWKAMAINVSDVSAMGGLPLFAAVSLGIPETWTTTQVDALYRGMNSCAQTYGFSIVGGDTVRASAAFISVSMIGHVGPSNMVTRSGAKAGDKICVSGCIGGARTGLEVLGKKEKKKKFKDSIRKFLRPNPRLKTGGWLATNRFASAMIDISDGLASDIRHICLQSGLGCKIVDDLLPIHPEARDWAVKQGISPVEFSLASGEEYELLFTTSPDFDAHTAPKKNPEKIPITVIGEMLPRREGIRIMTAGECKPLGISGWDHFRH